MKHPITINVTMNLGMQQYLFQCDLPENKMDQEAIWLRQDKGRQPLSYTELHAVTINPALFQPLRTVQIYFFVIMERFSFKLDIHNGFLHCSA